MNLNKIKIINPEPDLDIEASYNFIDFLFNSECFSRFQKTQVIIQA